MSFMCNLNDQNIKYYHNIQIFSQGQLKYTITYFSSQKPRNRLEEKIVQFCFPPFCVRHAQTSMPVPALQHGDEGEAHPLSKTFTQKMREREWCVFQKECVWGLRVGENRERESERESECVKQE